MRSAWLFIFASLLCATQARAAQRVAVLPVILGDQVRAHQIFSAVEKPGRQRRALRMSTIDDYYSFSGAQLAQKTLGCGQDVPCMAKQLLPLGAELGLLVIVNGSLEPALLSLLLIDTRGATIKRETHHELKPGAPQPQLVTHVEALLDAVGYLRAGRLEVRVTPKNAQVVLRSLSSKAPIRPDAGAAALFTVPPRQYQVSANLKGFAPATAQVRIQSGAASALDLELKAQRSIWRSPWLWVGVSAAVVTAATTATILLVGKTRCVCAITADQGECMVCQ